MARFIPNAKNLRIQFGSGVANMDLFLINPRSGINILLTFYLQHDIDINYFQFSVLSP